MVVGLRVFQQDGNQINRFDPSAAIRGNDVAAYDRLESVLAGVLQCPLDPVSSPPPDVLAHGTLSSGALTIVPTLAFLVAVKQDGRRLRPTGTPFRLCRAAH